MSDQLLHDVYVKDARRASDKRTQEGAALLAGSRSVADVVDHNPFRESEPHLRSAWARGRRMMLESTYPVGTYASRIHDAGGAP